MSVGARFFCEWLWLTDIRYKLVLLYSYGGQNLNLDIEGKINLLVTFYTTVCYTKQAVSNFTKTLLFPHKRAFFWITHITHTRMQMKLKV